MTYNKQIEGQLVELVATDRLDIPVSSLSSKLKRRKPKLGQEIDLGSRGSYTGERVYARIETEDEMKAKGMKEGIANFSEAFPRYGAILKGMIEEQRAISEVHLYFGLNNGARLSAEDYVGVLQNLGFTETQAKNLYPALIDVSRRLSKKRDEERSVMIG